MPRFDRPVPRFDLFDLAGALVDYAETTLLHIGALTIHIGALPRESGLPESVSDRGALTDGGSSVPRLFTFCRLPPPHQTPQLAPNTSNSHRSDDKHHELNAGCHLARVVVWSAARLVVFGAS